MWKIGLRRRFRPKLLGPVTVLITLALGPACGAVELGINYGWWRLDPAKIAECPTRPAGVFTGAGALPQYLDQQVRSTVQQQLSSMHRSGFTSIRIRLAFWPRFKDQLAGPLIEQDGSISAQDQQKIKLFISDIAAAGFKTIEISFGFGRGENSIYCRREKWGDCFDPRKTEENWRLMTQGTEIALSTAPSSVFRFDLHNEGCPAGNLPEQTLANVRQYFQTMASRFQSRFGQNWLVSCANSPMSRRLRLLLDDLRQVGLTPKTVEIHSYKIDPREFEGSLTAANEMASQIGARLILGEMRYHSQEQASLLGDWLRRTPGSRLIDAMQWPLADPSTRCPIDTAPPYTPGPLQQVLGAPR